MSATAAGRQLTESHRVAQARLGALTVLAMRDLWPLLSPTDLNATTPGWLRLAEQTIRRHRTMSATLAAAYLTAFRSVELGAADPTFTAVTATDVASARVITSLVVTGPVAVRSKLARGIPAVKALADAESTSAAAGMRIALNGGRETIIASTEHDSKARGWQRVTSAKCCAFCAMLAIRGPVYRTSGSVDFHSHDSCACAAEPVYQAGSALPANSQRLRAIYNEATAGQSGATALTAFRQALAAAR